LCNWPLTHYKIVPRPMATDQKNSKNCKTVILPTITWQCVCNFSHHKLHILTFTAIISLHWPLFHVLVNKLYEFEFSLNLGTLHVVIRVRVTWLRSVSIKVTKHPGLIPLSRWSPCSVGDLSSARRPISAGLKLLDNFVQLTEWP